MNAIGNIEEQPLPENLADANDAITDLTGQIVSLVEALKTHHARHKMGVDVDWGWHHRAQTKLGFLKGERAALIRHMKILRNEARTAEKRHNLQTQKEIVRQVAEAKAARIAANNTRNDRRQGVGIKALRAFIAERAPHLMDEAHAAMTKAQLAFDAEYPLEVMK